MFRARIKKNFGDYSEFEESLRDLKNKTDSEIIMFVGMAGSVKGIPLMEISDEGIDSRSFAARIVDIISNVDKFTDGIMGRRSTGFSIYIDEKIIYYLPFSENIAVVGIAKSEKKLDVVGSWLNKSRPKLKQLLPQ